MKIIYFLFGIIVVSFSYTSCDRDPLGQDICKRDYAFTIPVTLTPSNDTFHLGDTLQISMNFPKNMIDDNSSDSFDLSSFPFNATINLLKIDELPFSDGPGMVSYKATNGDVNIVYLPYTDSEVVEIIFNKTTSRVFQFSCFMVLKRKGIFSLSYQSNDFFNEFNKFNFKNECRTKSVKLQYKLNVDSTDTNYELLKLSPDPNVVQISRKKFDNSGAFAFVVID